MPDTHKMRTIKICSTLTVNNQHKYISGNREGIISAKKV